MGRNNSDFAGSSPNDYTNPVRVPSSAVDESGILKPSSERPLTPGTASPRVSRASATPTPVSETTSQLKTADKVLGTTTIKYKDALSIAGQLHEHLRVLHQDLIKTGMMHPGLAEAHKHLYGDLTQDPSSDAGKSAKSFLDSSSAWMAQHKKEQPENINRSARGEPGKSYDGKAWEELGKGGEKLTALHKALLSASPKAADISITHEVKGSPLTITPYDLKYITKPKNVSQSAFRDQGKAPKTLNVTGREIPSERIRATVIGDEAVKAQGIGGKDVIREDLRKAVKAKLKGTPRVRKEPGTRTGIGPSTSMFNEQSAAAMEASDPTKPVSVEPLGEGVVKPDQPKKQPRPAPTEEKAVRNVGRQGK